MEGRLFKREAIRVAGLVAMPLRREDKDKENGGDSDSDRSSSGLSDRPEMIDPIHHQMG
jgi:hypothetical protein